MSAGVVYAVDEREPAVSVVVRLPALAVAELGLLADRRGLDLSELAAELLVVVVRRFGAALATNDVGRAGRRSQGGAPHA